ncbi:SusD/RagB family nutrient-binding outer membrane lipoprotein [Porphyromonas pogonae]|uniref:SusD/RagB family nutrient-binding outer membrane lipoprotein n=1 Tax=Porphyromonas pogonae TaxID=867595 RepID=UPI002E7813FD|nr:SusD/RagB family nutrient-binding outer membrane lipoprotein [Porphyromonas pogonae]
MKNLKYFFAVSVAAITLSSCGDFKDTNYDPNKPSVQAAGPMLLGAQKDLSYFNYIDIRYNPWAPIYCGYITGFKNDQFVKFDINMYSAGWIYRTPLLNVSQLNAQLDKDIKYANNDLGDGESVKGILECIRAFYFMHVTDILGNVPYREAFNAAEGGYTPKYDTQKFIYEDLDKRLSASFKKMNENIKSKYDIIYGGNISKWKKFNASLRMIMAMRLSDIEPAVAKERYLKAKSDGVISKNDENFSFLYLTDAKSANPLYDYTVTRPNQLAFAPSSCIIDTMLNNNDIRVVSYASVIPVGKEKDGDKEKEVYDFLPITFGMSIKDIGLFKEAHPDFSHFPAEMLIANYDQKLITAAHMKLIQAEAALRGWTSDKVADLYKEGITLSFETCNLSAGKGENDARLKALNLIDKRFQSLKKFGSVEEYIAQPQIALTGNFESDLKKIALQRWVNNYWKDCVESWADLRKLDYPVIKPGTAAAAVAKLPTRFIYHTDDFDANKENHKAGATTPDEPNTRLWWDVK